MKSFKTIVLLITLLCFCPSAEAQKPTLSPTQTIDSLLNEWHKNAADADMAYFDKIADDGIYIGTAEEERWTKQEFLDYSEKYFLRGEAWDFKPTERNITFSTDGSVAWFDELLDTWMGVCRGSGVLELQNGKWEIMHYHLSVPIPNEIINQVVKEIETAEEKQP